MKSESKILKELFYKILSIDESCLDFIINFGRIGYGVYNLSNPDIIKLSENIAKNILNETRMTLKNFTTIILDFAKTNLAKMGNSKSLDEENEYRINLSDTEETKFLMLIKIRTYHLSGEENPTFVLAFDVHPKNIMSDAKSLYNVSLPKISNINFLSSISKDIFIKSAATIYSDLSEVEFCDVFDINEIQRLQDLFSEITGLSSTITDNKGEPLTLQSNFSNFCHEFVYGNEVGRNKCKAYFAEISSNNDNAPIVKKCEGGLWNASVSITFGEHHIANWIIGQVRNGQIESEELLHYANQLNVGLQRFEDAYFQVPEMPLDKFKKIADFLFSFVNEISQKAYHNFLLINYIDEGRSKDIELQESEELLSLALYASKQGLFDLNLITGEMIVNDEYATMLGYNNENYFTNYDILLDGIHPDDKVHFLSTFNNYINLKSKGLNVEFRQKSFSGEWIWIALIGKTVEFDSDNRPTRLMGTYNDIHQKKLANEALIESEERYKMLVEFQNDYVVKIDNSNNFIYVSPSFCGLLGKNESQILNKSLFSFIHPDDIEHILISFVELNKPPYTCYVEIRMLTDAGWKWIAWSNKAVYNSENKYEFTNGVGRDVTEIKLAQKELVDKRYQSEILADLASSFSSLDDPTEIFKVLNEKLFLLTNSKLILYSEYDKSQAALVTKHIHSDKALLKFASNLLGNNLQDYVSPLDPIIYEALIKESVLRSESFTEITGGKISSAFDKVLKVVSGFKRFFAISYVLSGELFGVSLFALKSNQADPPIELLKSFAHITAVALRRMVVEDKYKIISRGVEQTQALVVITDSNGVIAYVNPSFCETTGYSYNEAIGQKPSILKSGNTPRSTYNDLWHTITNGKQWQGELLNRKKNGETYWESVTISPIANFNGEITNFIAVKQDISELKKVTQDLKEAKEFAEENDNLKTAFLQNISHEIRTPLNGIIGFTQLLKNEENTEQEVRTFSNSIEQSGKRLLEIVNNLVELSKIETGQSTKTISSVYLSELLDTLHRQFVRDAKLKGINFNKVIPEGAEDLIIQSDEPKLSLILENLLANALKFTYEGSVEFGFIPKSESLEFWVKDTGIGISEDIRNNIFEKFYQGEESNLSRNFEGAGIGLAICKSFVNMMGGEICFESEPGKGTKFWFTMPYNKEF